MKHSASLLLGCRRFRSDLAINYLKIRELVGRWWVVNISDWKEIWLS